MSSFENQAGGEIEREEIKDVVEIEEKGKYSYDTNEVIERMKGWANDGILFTQFKEGDSEFGLQGIIMEGEIKDKGEGGFLRIKLKSYKEEIFVLYNWRFENPDGTCFDNIDKDLKMGDLVEVKGNFVSVIDGFVPDFLLASTCFDRRGYVRKI